MEVFPQALLALILVFATVAPRLSHAESQGRVPPEAAGMDQRFAVSHSGTPSPPRSRHSFDKLSLESVGIRYATNEGDNLKSDLRLYDVFAGYQLPWSRSLNNRIDLDARLTVSIGLLDGKDDATIYGSLAPGLACTDRSRIFFLEASAGIAVVPNYTLGPEDFGGPLQFTLDAGLAWRFYKNLSLGYRYYHFSDAGLYGPDNRGVDMHMVELTTRYLRR